MTTSTSPKGIIGGFMDWIDARLPVTDAWNRHAGRYYAPKNFNLLYIFGVLSMVVLVNQIVTGIFLTMHYKVSAAEAFGSIEFIMRDVPWGWLIRYLHTIGASAFFIVVYLHMFRALLYGSYRKPRELVWIFGMFIYLIMMAEAFMGYVLPWGQMSYWGAQVIISLFGAIPWIGDQLVLWIRGDYVVSDATLNRFFALHVIAIPLMLLMMVVLHVLALHEVGSNNPDGIEIKKHKDANGIPLDGIRFHPYYSVKDTFYVGIFFILLFFVILYAPTFGGWFMEYDNWVPANPLLTPEDIKPVWYFTPYYAILKAVPNKLGGVIAMGTSVMILFGLPWLDRSKAKSIRYRGWLSKVLIAVFAVAFIVLGKLGASPVTPARLLTSQVLAAYYFAFFLLMPWWSQWDNRNAKPVPERVTYK